MRVPDAAVTSSGGAIVSSTRGEEVSTRLRRVLLTGELRPGQRIKEVHLAEALGVSHPTLRESLQQLVHEGALVQVPYKGIHVAQPTADELRDVAEVRMPLETMAALRLSREANGPAMDGLREALALHLAAIESGDDLQAHVTHLGLYDPPAADGLTKPPVAVHDDPSAVASPRSCCRVSIVHPVSRRGAAACGTAGSSTWASRG